MQFIETLKLKSKLFFLFIITTIALIGMGIIGTIHIDSMKKNIDALYFGSLVPVIELNEIIQTYHNGLASTIYQASRLEVSPEQSATQIRKSLNHIIKKWKNYESHFKRDDEMEYVSYTDLEINNINKYFFKVYSIVKEGKDLSNISIRTLEKKVFTIHKVIQKLIKYEVSIANYERKKFLFHYERTKQQLGITLVFILSTLIIISLYVFKSIQSDQTKLEITTNKLKRVNKKLENVSYTDALTNLHNRRYFNMVYDKELKCAQRSNDYITFMMLDIDYFKQYNDTYGHLKGDEALKVVAQTLKHTLKRPSDYIFRLGGEEFGVLLTSTDESNSAKLSRDICDAIRGQKIDHKNSLAHEYVTISIGVVCCIADAALNGNILLSCADKMLYKSKEGGRDRCTITSNVCEASVGFEDDSLIA